MIKTIDEIKALRESKKKDLEIRLDPNAKPTAHGGRMHIMVCGGTGCTSANSLKIIENLENAVAENNLGD